MTLLCAVLAAVSATNLCARYLETRRPEDKKAWYAACAREGIDVAKRVRSVIDGRGVYKLNRSSRLASIVLGDEVADTGDWTEDLGADGRLHVAWTRRPNGAIDYTYSAPTNWEVYVQGTKGRVTRYGAKVMKRTWGEHPLPKVELPAGWRVVKGEEFTGVNVREAFFTFETDGTNAPPPRVAVAWPEAGVRAVYGATGIVVSAEGPSVFFPTAKKPPVSTYTSFPQEGCVCLGLAHHIKGMQAGPYRNVPYPENEIRAGYNFAFALREGFLHLGFGQKDAIAGGKVVLMGFDSHYPNGHPDFPAHFHIINDCRDGNQVSHFYMDPATGRITSDCFQDMNRPSDCWDRVWEHRPGDAWPMFDGCANVIYTAKILEDGTGLEIVSTNGAAFRVAGKRPCEKVDLRFRDGEDWRLVRTVSVEDDPVRGVMRTPYGDWVYDPDTAELLVAPDRDAGTSFVADALRPYVERGILPGAISVLIDRGRRETACVGWADFEAKRPISLDDVFMQCSQTKGFCGVTVAKLVEEGRVSLDDPVSKYLPEFKTLWVGEPETNGVRRLVRAKNAMTVRMVMNHTSGLPFELPAHEVTGWNHRMPLRSAAAEAASIPLLFEPGTGFKYSNIGIDVGAAVVAKVTEMPWEDYLRTAVLEPLGMTTSSFRPTDEQLRTKIEGYNTSTNAPPHHNRQFGPMPLPYNGESVFASAGAGLWTTARDQLKFYRMLMNLGVGDNGARILKGETVKEVLGRSSRPKGLGAYSLGFWCDDHGWIGHGGAWGTDAKINWKEKKLVLWVVQLGSGQRPWEKDAGAARDRFFNRRIDDSASSAYTGRLK